MATKFVNPYKILGIKRSATTKDIRDAFRKHAKENSYRGSPIDPEAFIAAKKSHDRLLDPAERARVNAIIRNRRLRKKKTTAQAYPPEPPSFIPSHTPPPAVANLIYRQGFQAGAQHITQRQQVQNDELWTMVGAASLLLIGAHLLNRS